MGTVTKLQSVNFAKDTSDATHVVQRRKTVKWERKRNDMDKGYWDHRKDISLGRESSSVARCHYILFWFAYISSIHSECSRLARHCAQSCTPGQYAELMKAGYIQKAVIISAIGYMYLKYITNVAKTMHEEWLDTSDQPARDNVWCIRASVEAGTLDGTCRVCECFATSISHRFWYLRGISTDSLLWKCCFLAD